MTPAHIGNLPAELSSFVGREREVADVARLLAKARLVTLTGTGGVGKTRVAVQAARQVRRTFPDGVWLVELASLADAAPLAGTVADTLGVCDRTTRLADHLADKRMLLVLDTCEHVLDACADLVQSLLGASAGLRILATSRQVLGVPGEHLVDVAPFSLPEPDRLTAGEAGRYDAVRLFVARAAAVRPGFTLTDENCPAVARICVILEGIPLAIEMTAWRLHVLSVEELLARLDDRFALLKAGSSRPPARHETLLAAIRWSFDLCSPAEQSLWTRLSVFAGGFDLAAAEAVCADGTVAREDVVDLLVGLANKSVLSRQDHDTGARYHMLDSLRDYGRARLSGVDSVALRCRHRDWCGRLAERFEEEWFGPHQPDWCARLRRELANLRVALDFCRTEPGERQAGLALATALRSCWVTCGLVDEGYRWLTLLLEAAPEPTPLRAKALWVTGWLALVRGNRTAARAALDECRVLAARFDHCSAMAYAVRYSGYSAMSAGDYPAAVACYAEALARHRAGGDELGVTTALFESALCHCLRGDPDHAIALCAECLGRSATRGDTWCRSRACYVLGVALWRRGGHERDAELAVREGITLSRALDDVLGIGAGLELLAWLAADDGHAARLTGAARRIWRSVGAPLGGLHELLEYQKCVESRLRAALGPAGFAAAVASGGELTTEEAVRHALGENVPAVVPAPPGGQDDQLTRREWQVADLVAKGMSNKEIAAALGIVRRTAEAHVQHILTKLGFSSRVRLAAWVVEQRVAGGGRQ